MSEKPSGNRIKIQLYDGYGHSDRLLVFGHVLKRIGTPKNHYTPNMWHNATDMLTLFLLKPYPEIKVRLHWNSQVLETVSGKDGFFTFEWKSDKKVAAGWHIVQVKAFSEEEEELKSGEGSLYVPHSTQLGIISDIDDTIMVSHSSRLMWRMREIFIKNSRSRKLFPATARFYQLLSLSGTDASTPNPFFYVSSSEWNLYGYLTEFFRYNDLPKGIFLLNQIKRWFQLLKTGKTNHHGKAERIRRILQTFPKQNYILLGDNSQADPLIYSLVAEEFGNRVVAVFIRNVRPSRTLRTTELLSLISAKGIHTCFYNHSREAISFSVEKGLLKKDVLDLPEPTSEAT